MHPLIRFALGRSIRMATRRFYSLSQRGFLELGSLEGRVSVARMVLNGTKTLGRMTRAFS